MDKNDINRIFNIGTRRLKRIVGIKSPHEKLISNFKFPSDIDKKYTVKFEEQYQILTVNDVQYNSVNKLYEVVRNYYEFLSHKSLFRRYKGFSFHQKMNTRRHSYLRRYLIECTVDGVVFLEIESDNKTIDKLPNSSETKITHVEKDLIPYFIHMSNTMKLYHETKEDYIEAKKILKVDRVKNKLRKIR